MALVTQVRTGGQITQISGTSAAAAIATAAATVAEAASATVAAQVADLPVAAIDNAMDGAFLRSFTLAGATAITTAGGVTGIATPAASSGLNSGVEPEFRLDGAVFGGATMQMRLTAATSAAFTRSLSVTGLTFLDGAGATLTPPGFTVVADITSAGRRAITIQFVPPSATRLIRPFLQQTAAAVAATPESWQIDEIFYWAVTGTLRPAADTNVGQRLATLQRSLLGQIASFVPPTIITVAPSGGDFTHPKLALDTITDAAPDKPYVILIRPGRYTGYANMVMKHWVDLVGTDRDTCIIHHELPDNVDPALIPGTSTLFIFTTTRLANLTITGRNVQYPVHEDDGNTLTSQNAGISYSNVHVEHLGNDGARAWQAANGGNPASVWPVEVARGAGSSSGMIVTMEDSDFIGPHGGNLGSHNNTGFTRPSVTTARNCRTVATRAENAATVLDVLGSGQADRLIMEGCTHDGGINLQTQSWAGVDPAYQPANRAEIDVSGFGCTPAAFRITDFGRALRIVSASTGAGSRVEIVAGGSAVAAIFGLVSEKPVVTGIVNATPTATVQGAAHGSVDVSGVEVGPPGGKVQITSLGRRLGNCSGGNAKSFQVKINGASPVTINFTTDLTNATNQQVLDIINAALGAAATAGLLAVAEETVRPRMRDEERTLKNTSAVAIWRRAVLAWNANRRSVRLMTEADDVALYAGVAWEDIIPGASGRVKVAGYLPFEDMVISGAFGGGAGYTMGQSFGIDAGMPGRLVQDGAGLLPIVNPLLSSTFGQASSTHAVSM